MASERPTTPAGQHLVDAQPLYCERCDNPRPLGMVYPGVFSWRAQGRTVVVAGGIVTVCCERCGKEHTIVLDAPTV